MPVFAVTTAKGANWDRARDIREQPFWEEHGAFADQLVDRGVIIIGGPVGSDDDDDIALLAVEAADETTARSVFDADPWTVHQVFRVKDVRPWALWLDGRPRRGPAPDLHMLNLVVADMAASLEFYRRLGVAVPDGADAAGPHAQLRMPGGFSLELDTADSVRFWHAGWRADPASARVVIGFALATRQALDERYAELTSAGYAGRQPPFDAFWGGRYAIVADPDGNDVGLMSPIDEARRTWPPQESPGMAT